MQHWLWSSVEEAEGERPPPAAVVTQSEATGLLLYKSNICHLADPFIPFITARAWIFSVVEPSRKLNFHPREWQSRAVARETN